MQKEEECPCTKADCERHGDCVACFSHHKPMEKQVFCMRPENIAPEVLRARVLAKLQAAGISPVPGTTGSGTA